MRYRWLLLVLLIILLPVMSHAVTRYVDTNCGTVTTYNSATRACTGGSASNYATGQAGANATLAAGDILYFRAGTHTLAGTPGVNALIIKASGTIANPITIAGYPGETVTLNTSGNPLGVLQVYRSDVIIKNLIIDGTGISKVGVYLGDGAATFSRLTFIDNELRNVNTSSAGCMLIRLVDDVYVARNKIHNCGLSSVGHNIYHSRGKRAIYEYNELYDGWNLGIQMRYGGTSNPNDNTNSIIRYNDVHDNNRSNESGLGGINIATGTNIQAYGNIVDSNGLPSRGIFADTNCVNCKIVNNSIYNHTEGVRILGSATAALVQNNIILTHTTPINDLSDGATLVSNTTIGTVGDFWVNAAARGFTQIATAPSINAGTPHTTYCPEPGGTSLVTCDRGTHQRIPFSSGSCSGNTMVLNFDTKFPPLQGLTTFTARAGASPLGAEDIRTVSGVTKTGNSQYTWTISGPAIVASDLCDFSYTAGTVTDCAAIGRGTGAACSGSNQPLFAITNQTLTNTTGASSPVYTSAVCRAEEHNGVIGAWFGGENLSIELPSPSRIRWCCGMRVTVANAPSQDYRFIYSLNGGADTDITDTSATITMTTDTEIDSFTPVPATHLSLGGTTAVDLGYLESPLTSPPAIGLNTGQQGNKCAAFAISSGLTPGDTIDVRLQPDTGTVVETQLGRIVIGAGTARSR